MKMGMMLLALLMLVSVHARAANTAEKPRELVLQVSPQIPMKLALIPAGKFMRCNEGDANKPNPATHEVTISKPFYIGVFEVTQEQYEAVMGKNPVASGNPENTEPKNPVTMMVWPQAVEFCKKLSEKTGRKVRLPSEGEWEYAARAGTTGARHCGEDLEEVTDYAWVPANAGGHKTHPVGELKPNPWGLYDTLGNVWEMTSDWFAPFDDKPVMDPKGPDTPLPPRKNFHVTKGGSFYAGFGSVTSRYGYPDDVSKRHIGFRVLVEAE